MTFAATPPKKFNGQWAALATMLPHLWPKGQFEMRARVVVALLCLALAKFFNIFVPMLFKRLVDGLVHKPDLAITLEIGLVCGILWYLYDWRYAAVTFVTIGGYIWFTFALTEWRIKHRRQMNEADQEANTKAIDSLLNYETVKYFGNEEHEARRYDVALQSYETAAVRTRVSLAFLNIGQNAIIAVGVTLLMGMAAMEVVQGRATVGDFVLVNAYLIQLYLPLNFLGTVYREIRQALIDMEAMF